MEQHNQMDTGLGVGKAFLFMSGIPSRNYTKTSLIFQRSTAQGDGAGQHWVWFGVISSPLSHDAVYNTVFHRVPRRSHCGLVRVRAR